MNKKVALALAGLVLMMTFSFAPVSIAQWPPAVQYETYVIMGGQKVLITALEYGPLTFVLPGPFATRSDPYLKPYEMIEDMCFSPIIDVSGVGAELNVVFVNITAASPLIHYVYSPDVGGVVGMPWLKISEIPLPGFGFIYVTANIADVDYYTYDDDTGVYWDTPGDPYGLNGTRADLFPAPGYFLSPGADGLPGFLPTKDDGFGDGIPDPAGASVIYQPEIFQVEGWNETAGTWDLLMGAPLMITWTTGTAYDHMAEPTSALYCNSSMKTGNEWEELKHLMLYSGYPLPSAAAVTVTYVAAGSVCDYLLDPGPPRIALDILYDIEEKKVRDDQIGNVPGSVVADISCDQKVNIEDIAICTTAFGAYDEGLGPDNTPNTPDDRHIADPRYDARADLDCNGLIDIFDLVRIALDFGEELFPPLFP